MEAAHRLHRYAAKIQTRRRKIQGRAGNTTAIPTSNARKYFAQFDILDGHLFASDTHGENLFQRFVLEQALLSRERFDLSYLQSVKIVVETFQHTVESHFGRIWDEREYRMPNIVIDGN